MRTWEEHLEFSKGRALEYLDQGELANAMASMLSDIQDFNPTFDPTLMLIGLQAAAAGDAVAVRRFIEGFR